MNCIQKIIPDINSTIKTKIPFKNIKKGFEQAINNKTMLVGLTALAVSARVATHFNKKSKNSTLADNQDIPEQNSFRDINSNTDKTKQNLCNVSDVSQINRLLLYFKDAPPKFIQIIETKMFKFYEESKDKEEAIEIMDKLITSYFNRNLRDFYINFLVKENKENYVKAFRYLKEHGLENSDIFFITDRNDSSKIDACIKKGFFDCVYFDIEGNFIKRILSRNTENEIAELVETPDGRETYRFDKTSGEHTRIILDPNDKVVCKETYTLSKLNPDCHEISSTYIKGEQRLIKKLEDSIIEIDTIPHKDNSTTTFKYIEGKDGSRSGIIINIANTGKKNCENTFTRKVINENYIQTFENGKKYDILYEPDRVIVTKNNSEQVIIEIGENSENSPEVLSRELLPVIKELPGSAFFAIDKFKLKKIGKDIDNVQAGIAHYSAFNKTIALSEEKSSNKFTLLHEFGHYIHRSLEDDDRFKELMKIYRTELRAWENQSSNIELFQSHYLIDKNSIAELFADLYASRFASGSYLDFRIAGVKRNFPKTYRYMIKILQKEGL